ncbi:MAG: pyridoxal phosphate-dependent aminotransferase [Phycisphaerales bacterium]|nr:pyridoxal phosphate-dependent aminotransferase [Phycisphaerales bacterium]
MQLSRRVLSLKTSSTLAVTNRAKALVRQGIDVIPFAAGEPDFDTPAVVKEAAIGALRAGQTKYMPTAGDPETRQVIAEKLDRENAISGVTAEHVVITTGGKHAIYLVLQALLDRPPAGEAAPEVLLPVPAWVSYDPIARMCGANVVEIPTEARSGFKMTPEQLRGAITARARVLVMNSPSNPCGTMYSPRELKALGAVVADAARTVAPDLVVVTDEIYEKIVYGEAPHFSMGAIPEIAERTVTINGLSKAFAMTGWRVGYLAGSGAWGLELARAAEKLQGQMTTNITSFVYPAIRVALTRCGDDVERMRLAFKRRAELIYGEVSKIPELVCPRPTGAFYVFPDVSAYFGRTTAGGRAARSAQEMAEAILEEARVAVVPGEDFGGCGRDHIRLSFACADEKIIEGMGRLRSFFGTCR